MYNFIKIFCILVMGLGWSSYQLKGETSTLAHFSLDVILKIDVMTPTEHNRIYFKTKKGISTAIYNDQKKRSRKLGYPIPNYTLLEFRKWLFSQPNFEQLFWEWTMSGNDKWLKPSADRLNDYLPYTFDNLRLVTWMTNKLRYHLDAKNGINNKMAKSVIGTHKITGESVNFYSISDAGRKLGIKKSHISGCCLCKIYKDGKGINYTMKSAGGYKWRFSDV